MTGISGVRVAVRVGAPKPGTNLLLTGLPGGESAAECHAYRSAPPHLRGPR